MIGKYIKFNWKKFLYIVIVLAVIFAAMILEGVAIAKLLYPALLAVFAVVLYMAGSFYKFYKLHREIEIAKENIDVTLERLPEPENLSEDQYQELVRCLFSQKEKESYSYNESRKNLENFLTMWTHQIKTPLTALELSVKDLPIDSSVSAGTEITKDLQGRLFEIEQYCDNMLTYLKIGGDGSDYIFESQNVLAMVKESVRYFARTFISKGLSVRLDIDETATLVTDQKWLVFALKQVLSNSLKYTKEGQITIDMPSEDTIRISDTGIGISQEDLPRILERGYTGYNGRMDKKATGMGLFLVKTIMDMLGGSVRIESELRKGTRVCLIFSADIQDKN